MNDVPVMDVLHPWQLKMHSQYISYHAANQHRWYEWDGCSPAWILHAM